MTRYITVAEALFESRVNNHPFVDGNKRGAFAVVDVLLRVNGYRMTAIQQASSRR